MHHRLKCLSKIQAVIYLIYVMVSHDDDDEIDLRPNT
jgi:hypothetical protein